MLQWIRKYWLAAVGVLGLLALVLAVNPVSLGRVLRHANLVDLALMLPVVAALYVSRGLGWWVTLRRFGLHISPLQAVWVLFAAKPIVFLPLGELGRVAILEVAAEAEGHDVGELTGTVAFQELMYLTLTGLILIPGIVRFPDLGAIVGILLVLQILIFAVLFWEPAYERAIRLVEHLKILQRYDCQLHHIRNAFVKLWDARTFLLTLLCNSAGVGLAFLLFYLSLHAVGAVSVGYADAGLVYSLAFILAGFSFLPGSLGVYEGLITFVLSVLGVQPFRAAGAALIFRGYYDLLIAVVGFVMLLPLRRRMSRGVSLKDRLQECADRPAIVLTMPEPEPAARA
jgi:uncharacterized membrane protein YbhN (UPF0104 family)